MPGGKIDKNQQCKYCHALFNIRGLGSHERACKVRQEREDLDKRSARALSEQRAKHDKRERG